MADTTDVRYKQRIVIEFLIAEKETVGNIHKRLCAVYGTFAVDRSTVSRWAQRVLVYASGDVDLADKPRSGRPATATCRIMLERAEIMIRRDRRITSQQLSMQLSISKGSAIEIFKNLGYSKVCARWVPRALTEDHKAQRKTICSELLRRFEAEGDGFLSKIVTGDETWVHHFDPETKRQSMEWHHPQSPVRKKFKTTPSAGKVMVTVFWDIDGVILVDVLPKGGTINSETYIKTLTKLNRRYRRVRPHKDREHLLLLHDNARPHTSLQTKEAIDKMCWNILPHPPYSPDLAPSDFHLFGPLKNAIRGTKFEDNEGVINAAKKWLREQDKMWYRSGIHALVSRWRKAVKVDGDYVEK